MRKWCCGVHQMKVLASQGANCRHTWMLQLLHWPHGSIDFHCCTCYAAHHAPPAAMAARLTTLQLLHWPRRSPCSNCCTGHTDQHAPTGALATQFSIPPSAALATQLTMRRALHLRGHVSCARLFLLPHSCCASCTLHFFRPRFSSSLTDNSFRARCFPHASHFKPPSRFDRAFASHSSHTA